VSHEQDAQCARRYRCLGPGVNGNFHKLTELDIEVYTVFDIDQRRYYSSTERLQFCKELNIPHVPFIEYRKFDFTNLDDALKYADGDVLREGVVFKSISNPWNHFKIISNKFLLKKED
jgi:ATP-dependent RNA circularization protein (DNA/RNA ligase family)